MYNAIYPIPGKEINLPFYLTGIGKTSPEFNVKRETGLTSYQFLITTKGEGILHINGNRFFLKPGSLLFLPPEIAHEYRPVESEWSTSWFVFRGTSLSQIMTSLGLEHEFIAENINTAPFEKLHKRLTDLAGDNLHNSSKCSLLIYDFILMAKEAFEKQISSDNTGNIIIDHSLEFIRENLHLDISLNDLSKAAGVSPQYIGQLFKKKLNTTPVSYISRAKISKAKILLLDSSMSIAEIAFSLGYSSPTYFGIVFKKFEGFSPSEYRRNNGSVI